MKIYFAGAIRGGREDVRLYQNIINYLIKKGTVLTEHVGDIVFNYKINKLISDKDIFNRDIAWIQLSDVFIAEITTPSLGVGYELAIAEKNYIPIMCLYREISEKSISAMIKGNESFNCMSYSNFKEIKMHIDQFMKVQINNLKLK